MTENFGAGIAGAVVLIDPISGAPYKAATTAELSSTYVAQEDLDVTPGASVSGANTGDQTLASLGAMQRITGTGSPEGVVTAGWGSRYIDSSGANGAFEWIKLSDGALNTGWKVSFGRMGWKDLITWDAGAYTYNALGNLSPSFAPLAGVHGMIAYRRVGAHVQWWIMGIQAAAALTANTWYDLFIPSPMLPVGLWADDGSWALKGLNATHSLNLAAIGTPTTGVKLQLRMGASYASGANIISSDGATVSTLLTRDDIWPSSLPGITHTGTPTP